MLGVRGVRGVRARLGLGLGVRPLDVDLGRDAAGRQDVAEPQRVPANRVTAVQHRHELVDAAHAERALPSSSGVSRLTKRSAADSRSSSASRLRARFAQSGPPWGVGEQVRDGCGQRVGILVRDERAGPAQHLRHRPLVERDDREPGAHRLHHGDAEALVLRGHDEHIRGGIGRRHGGVARVPGEGDGIGQSHLGDVAVQGGDVGVRGGFPDDLQRRRRVAVGPGDGQRGDGALDRLVGRHPADGQPPRAPPPGGAARPVAVVTVGSSAADGGITAVVANPAWARCAWL